MILEQKTNRIPELDGLRGLAILLVICNHYICIPYSMINFTTAKIMYFFLHYTWSGVDLFFVLSGFLIGGILIDQLHTKNFLKVFYLRRICRILPPYFLSIGIFFSLKTLLPHWTNTFVNPYSFNNNLVLWKYLTFVQNFFIANPLLPTNGWFSATWSLAVEEQFYLILPALIFFTPKSRAPWILLSLIIFTPILRLMLFNYSGVGNYGFFLMPCRMDSLFLGVVIAYLYRNPLMVNFFSKNLKLIYSVFILSFLTLMMSYYREVVILSKQMTFLGLSLISLFYGSLLMLVLLSKGGILSFITRLKFLRKFGVISYGMYIYHMAILELSHGIIRKDIPFHGNFWDFAVTLFAFIVLVALSYVSWVAFERPIIQYGHRFKYQQ